MREPFLIHMDGFDRLLEFQLRRKLDPIVAAPVPVRRGRAWRSRPSKLDRHEPPIKIAGCIPVELRPDTLAFVARF